MQGIGDDSPGEYEIQCYLLLAFHQDNFDEMKEYSNWAVDYELLGNHSIKFIVQTNFSAFNIKENYCITILSVSLV